MVQTAVFIGGLLIGSFLNVCIYRIPRDQSIVFPASHCAVCARDLRFWELIPVISYLFLRGHCRTCGARISPRYPLVEVLTGLVFLLLYSKYGLSIDFWAAIFLMSVLLVVFFVDYDHMIIPDKLVVAALLGAVLLVVYNCFWPVSIYGDRNWWNPLLGALLGSGLLLLVALVGAFLFKTEAMGGGDIKILFPIGLFLGWRLLLLALFLSILIAGGYALILLLGRRISRQAMIPFGPFLVIGTFLSLIWGWQMLAWYISLL